MLMNLYCSSRRPSNATVELRLAGEFSAEDLAEAVDLIDLQVRLIRRYMDKLRAPETIIPEPSVSPE